MLFANPTHEPAASRATLGQNAVVVTRDTTAITGDFYALQCLTDTVFSLLTEAGATGGVMTGFTVMAGTILYGRFSAYTLTSGIVRAYSAA
jgi:hypothetical protein